MECYVINRQKTNYLLKLPLGVSFNPGLAFGTGVPLDLVLHTEIYTAPGWLRQFTLRRQKASGVFMTRGKCTKNRTLWWRCR